MASMPIMKQVFCNDMQLKLQSADTSPLQLQQPSQLFEFQHHPTEEVYYLPYGNMEPQTNIPQSD